MSGDGRGVGWGASLASAGSKDCRGANGLDQLHDIDHPWHAVNSAISFPRIAKFTAMPIHSNFQRQLFRLNSPVSIGVVDMQPYYRSAIYSFSKNDKPDNAG